MKKTKTLAVIILSWISLNGNVTSATNIALQNKFSDKIQATTSITADDIIKYLEDLGYEVQTTPLKDHNDWTCNTALGGDHYLTTVHTDGTNIVAHEDIRL